MTVPASVLIIYVGRRHGLALKIYNGPARILLERYLLKLVYLLYFVIQSTFKW